MANGNGKGKDETPDSALRNVKSTGFENLSLAQRQMLILLAQGERLTPAYRKTHPKSKANPNSMHVLATEERKIIYEKMGGFQNIMRAAGLGEERIIKVIEDAVIANKIHFRGDKAIEVPDTLNRIRGAKLLVDVFGLKEQTVRFEGEVKVTIGAPDFVEFQENAIAEVVEVGGNGDGRK